MYIERPVGSVVSPQEIYDVISRGQDTPIYLVEQMGHQTTFILNSKVTIEETNCGFLRIDFGDYNRRCLGDLNIGGSHNEHYAFWDKDLADQYSARLKNDPEYVQSVKDHWAHCDEMDELLHDENYYEYNMVMAMVTTIKLED